LGTPSNQARARLKRRLPIVAAPALVGVAAAFAFANTPASAGAHSVARPSGHHTVVPAAAHTAIRSAVTATAHRSSARGSSARGSSAKAARLVSATRPAATRNVARPVSYTVKSGDTLSTIAGRFYRDADYWPVLYWANHNQIQFANQISVGQVLTVPVKPAHIPGAPTAVAPAPVTASVSAPAGGQSPASADTAANAAPAQSANVSTAGDSSFQACVIQAESGGDSQVMNSSGHYGLYQFSASTWAAYGGNPADFGDASVAEQNQVFENAMAAGGASNWSAYDGC
jgi:LysM repeat protein